MARARIPDPRTRVEDLYTRLRDTDPADRVVELRAQVEELVVAWPDFPDIERTVPRGLRRREVVTRHGPHEALRAWDDYEDAVFLLGSDR